MNEDGTILDAVATKLAHLRATLGGRDRAKLDEYTEAIRDVERRIRLAEQQGLTDLSVAMEQPSGVPAAFSEHARLMFDLQVLAYQADLTRVITFMVAHETSNRAYPEINVSDAHHPLSHHGGDKEKIAKLIDVNIYHAELFAYYLDRLAQTEDGDVTVMFMTITNFRLLLSVVGRGHLKGDATYFMTTTLLLQISTSTYSLSSVFIPKLLVIARVH